METESNKKFVLTDTDNKAISSFDSNYINSKGATHYVAGDYPTALEYYRIAAAMGNLDAISNLGYCYLYGRSIEKNFSIAMAYFTIAAQNDNVDACYKLGDIYESGHWGVKDDEMSTYYYRKAASEIIDSDWNEYHSIITNEQLKNYPSLCFALGRALMPGGNMNTNLTQAFQFLLQAKAGYQTELANGATMYQSSYDRVTDLLKNTIFDGIRTEFEEDNQDSDDSEDIAF